MTLLSIAAFVSWPEKAGTVYEGKMSEEASKEELFQYFQGWEDEVRQLLQVSCVCLRFRLPMTDTGM